jgi:hypothetical protein
MNKEEREQIIGELLEKFPIHDIVSFNEFDIHDKLAKNADLYISYYEHYLSEKQEFARLEELKTRLVGIIYDELRFPTPQSTNEHAHKNLDRKEIIEYYIPRDKRYIKLLDIIEKQRVRVEFFEIAAKAIDKTSWNARNFLESFKLLK